jgi:deoxycytidine triphosphate deaminase
MLIVLIGVRGAGKTTLQSSLQQRGVRILQPSTTRGKRGRHDREYDFVKTWDESLYAWKIPVGSNTYGMRSSELANAANEVCVTVFEPTQMHVFEGKRSAFPFETLTVGLDTISDLTEQHNRVGSDETRQMDSKAFTAAREAVASCDIVLGGDADTILSAVETCLSIIGSRGGLLTKEQLSPLMASGAILHDADLNNLRSASYDLRVGDEIWCQGQLIKLDAAAPRFSIPPYSYAIVSAREIAKLPPFIVGRFDLKVSFFFEGIILSNGPQVDPGYKGALFCMLYNGSGKPKLITRDKQFATMDFTTTTRITEGYKQKYQFQERMERFMTDDAITGHGGAIVELIDAKISVVDGKVGSLQKSFWAIAAAILVVVFIPATVTIPYLWSQMSDVRSSRELTQERLKSANALLKEIRRERILLDNELRTRRTPESKDKVMVPK